MNSTEIHSRKKHSVLIVEDDCLQRENLKKFFCKEGHNVKSAKNSTEAINLINNEDFDVSFVDLDLEYERAGFDLIKPLKSRDVYTVVLTGHDEDSFIEEGYNRDCNDYLKKPFSPNLVSRALEKYTLSANKQNLLREIKNKFITQDPDHLSNYEKIAETFGVPGIPLFINGPSGCGKSELIKLCHRAWYGSESNFASFEPNTIGAGTLQSELFGHTKGAFTGANSDQKGLFTKAHNGTLFIDEVGTIDMGMQTALLGALSSKEYSRVGDKYQKKLYSNFKLVTATCDDLIQKIANGDFRGDFYNRISGTNVVFKPLRDRRKDISLLLDHVKANFGRSIVIRKDAEKALINYDWPGNEREFFTFWERQKHIEKPIFTKDTLDPRIVNNEYPRNNQYQFATEKHIESIKNGVSLNELVKNIELEIFQHFIDLEKIPHGQMKHRKLMRIFGVSQTKITNLYKVLNNRSFVDNG